MIYNKENKGHINGHKLISGEALGVHDTINIMYPQLEKLYNEQMGQIWNEFEVDLTQDRMDMLKVPSMTCELMQLTIMWQHLSDTLASRSLVEVLGEFSTDSQLDDLLTAWQMFETIHKRTYSHIIKQTFLDPNEGLTRIYENSRILERSKHYIKAIEDVQDQCFEGNLSREEQFFRVVVNILCMETIAFMSSFAVTFAIAETGVFQGISQNVNLICRDEILHSRISLEILRILKKEHPELFASAFRAKEIIDSYVKAEKEWNQYLFSEGRNVVGLNAKLLDEFVDYMATPIYRFFGIQYENAVTEQPLHYMEKQLDSTKIQAAAQEIQLTNYNIGVIEDDTDSLGELD